MDKYPILRMVSTLVRIVGWVFLIISAILFFVGLANLGGNSILGTVGGILAIVNSLSLALFSLILIVIGEAVQVFIDIEKNTSMTAVLIWGFSHENSGNIGNPETLNTVSPNVFPKPFQSLSGTTLTLGKHRKIRQLALASDRIRGSGGTEGRGDAAAGELFAGGIRRQEEADAAGQVFGRDGAGGAVGAAGRSSSAVLPEGRTRTAADRAGADAAAVFFAAVVRAGRRGAGGRALR
jgi:hypothetical protein